MSTVENTALPAGRQPDGCAISPEEIARRQSAAESARHSLRIEGLSVSAEAEEISAKWQRGEITGEEMTARILDLHRRRD